MSSTVSYSQSKLVSQWAVLHIFDLAHSIAAAQGNVVYAQEFARRHGDKIVSVSVHPGSVLV